jgi:hypothetical protein
MKISYRNYPILEKLQNKVLGVIPIYDEDKMFFDLCGEAYTNNWKFYSDNFIKDINIITDSFYKSSEKAQSKLIDLWGDICHNDTSDFNVKGCYIFGDMVYMIDYEIKQGSQDNELVFYIFDKIGMPVAMYIDSAKYKIHQHGWISNVIKINQDKLSIMTWILNRFAKVVIFSMFKSYAEIETKILQPREKLKDVDCKYVNDTKLKLTWLDCKWFTNLIKSDSFNVRGHFRLQPCKKDGLWTKELIWIKEFNKSGYTAPAKKSIADSE